MNSNLTIDDNTVNAVRGAVAQYFDVGTDVYTELQDGSTCLLVVITVPKSYTYEQFSCFKQVIKPKLAKLIPDKPGDYSWIIVIKQDDEVVDSIFSDIIDFS